MSIVVAEGGGGGGGPDWVVIGGGIATVLTVLGGIVAGLRGTSRARSTDDYHRRQARETAATANASLTLESVFRLVNELQEEGARKSTEITSVEAACRETKSILLIRTGELEGEIRRLELEVRRLEAEVRVLKRRQLAKE